MAIAKNYLDQDELQALGRIVNAYLDLAEERAQRKIPMTMEDWAKRLDAFLEFTERDILQDAGKVSAEMARAHAKAEFEKYRIVQDRLFERAISTAWSSRSRLGANRQTGMNKVPRILAADDKGT